MWRIPSLPFSQISETSRIVRGSSGIRRLNLYHALLFVWVRVIWQMSHNKSRYFLLSRVLPEIAMFETNEQRKAAMRHALSVTSHGSWRLWGWTLVYLLSTVGMIYGLLHLETRFPVASETANRVMPFALGATCLWLCRSLLRRRLRELLAAKGVPICIPCGYDLRGQLSPRCPECGSSFDEGLLTHPERDSAETGQPTVSTQDLGRVVWLIVLIVVASVAGYYFGHWLFGDG